MSLHRFKNVTLLRWHRLPEMRTTRTLWTDNARPLVSPGKSHLVRKLKMAKVAAPRATKPGQYTPCLASASMSMLILVNPSLSLSTSITLSSCSHTE